MKEVSLMPRPNGSSSSVNSNSSAYQAIRLEEGNPQARLSSASVPNDAPPLPHGATEGSFDANSGNYFARVGQQVARYATSTGNWVVENRKEIIAAIIDISPTVIQGAAAMFPGNKAAATVNIVGIVAQAGVAGYDMYQEGKRVYEGGQVDKAAVLASALRITSVATAAAATKMDPEKPLTSRITGISNFAAGGGTFTDLARHQRHDDARQMYDLGNNPRLGLGGINLEDMTSNPPSVSSASALSVPGVPDSAPSRNQGEAPQNLSYAWTSAHHHGASNPTVGERPGRGK
ncbi:hypothetical protein ACIPPJ_33350 [Streptomyces sp. NPDC086091]|uniref:hypothetical protein n=1 Tax=Streptomyces sp. NPDC086091 TaxID=3365751 RepID=UPI0038302ACC